VAGIVVYHMGLGTDRVYIHIEVERGPAVGVGEIRHEPRLVHTGEGEPEPGKWVWNQLRAALINQARSAACWPSLPQQIASQVSVSADNAPCTWTDRVPAPALEEQHVGLRWRPAAEADLQRATVARRPDIRLEAGIKEGERDDPS